MTRDDYMIGQVNVVANGLFQLVLILGKNNPALQAELAAAMQRMEAERVALNNMLKRTQESAVRDDRQETHVEAEVAVGRVGPSSIIGDGKRACETPAAQHTESTGPTGAGTGAVVVQRCDATEDGGCFWGECPQLRDGEPFKTGRRCPYDNSQGESTCVSE